MPPQCLNMSALLHMLLVDNSTASQLTPNLWETEHMELESFDVGLAHQFTETRDVSPSQLNSSHLVSDQVSPHASS